MRLKFQENSKQILTEIILRETLEVTKITMNLYEIDKIVFYMNTLKSKISKNHFLFSREKVFKIFRSSVSELSNHNLQELCEVDLKRQLLSK